jgi:uncharacterized membrane protein
MADNHNGRIGLLGGRVQLTRPQAVLAGIIFVYVMTFFLLAKRIYDGFGNSSSETAAANNIMWWMINGHPFRFSVMGEVNYLGLHVELFWPLLTPIYALAPGVPMLLFCQSLALGLTAWPVYLIVRRLWDHEVAGVLMGTAFIFMPAIAGGNLNQIHPVPYIPVFLLSAYYGFLEQRLGVFVVFATLACLVRENVSLGVGMFGVWAWVERRPWKWRLVPLVGGAVYFFIATQIIIPWGLAGRPWHLANYFSYLGTTPGEIVTNAITRPGLVLNHLLSGENIQYFVFLVQTVGWLLPFGHWAVLVGVPDLAGNLLSNNGGMKVLIWHYQFMTTTGVFMGAVCTLRRVLDWLRARYGGDSAALVGGGMLVLCLAHWFLWWQPQQFQPLPHRETLLRALAAVPAGKSVLAPYRLQGHVSDRARFDRIGRFAAHPEYNEQFEYVILDANERRFPPPITQEYFDSFRLNPKYRLIFAEKGVFVFQRLGGESDWKVPVPVTRGADE